VEVSVVRPRWCERIQLATLFLAVVAMVVVVVVVVVSGIVVVLAVMAAKVHAIATKRQRDSGCQSCRCPRSYHR
jgi:hypothetical protein